MPTGLGVAGLLMLAVGGYVAGIPLLQTLSPVNPIVVGALIAMVAIMVRPRGQPIPVAKVWPIVVLASAFGLGLFGADTWWPYTVEKLSLLATLTPLSVLGGLVILQTAKAVSWWLWASVALAAFIGAMLFVAPDVLVAESSRLALEGQNTIAAGRAPGAAVVILCVMALVRQGASSRLLLLGAGGVFAAIMLASGSRGPLAACLLAILIVAVLLRSLNVWLGLALAGVAGFAAWQWVGEAGYLAARLTTLSDASSQTRLNLYRVTWSEVERNPWGLGWGQLEIHLPPGFIYPHNLFLEVAAEAGWISALVLIWFISLALLRQFFVIRESASEAALFGLTIFFVMSAMVSGDANSHRAMWVTLGACLVASLRRDSQQGEEALRRVSVGGKAAPSSTHMEGNATTPPLLRLSAGSKTRPHYRRKSAPPEITHQ